MNAMFLVMALNSDLVSECVQRALGFLNLYGSSTQKFILKKEQESAETAKYVLQTNRNINTFAHQAHKVAIHAPSSETSHA